MPATVSHVLSATTPDDPAYEIRPSHWNSAHAFTFNAVGSEISGAFSNTPGGVTFGLETNGFITAGAPAGGGGITAINVSAGGASQNLSALTFNNGGGVSFGLAASVITASVATNYQSQGAYLTTAMASNASSVFAGVGETVTTTSGTDLALTVDTNGVRIAHPAWLTTAQAPGAYLTTAMASNRGSDFMGTNTALTANGVSMTANSSGLSLNFPAFLTTAQPPGAYLTTARASNDAVGLNTALTANGVAWTVNSSGISLNVPAFLTTAALSNHSHGNPTLALTNLSGTTASNSAGFTLSLSAGAGGAGDGGNILAAGTRTAGSNSSVLFDNANGITFGLNAVNGSIMTASHNGLTTARASNDGVGLNTAQTNVTWTVNSSGISINGAGYAGTGTTFAGANITLSGTNGSVIGINAPASSSLVAVAPLSISTNGSTISVSLASLGAYAVSNTTQSSSGTVSPTGLSFAGAGGVSVGVSNGSVVVSGAAGGGGPTLSVFEPYEFANNTAFSSHGQNTLYLQRLWPEFNYTFNNIEKIASLSFVSSTNSQAVSHTIRYGLYSRDTGTNSTRMTQVGSSAVIFIASFNSNTAGGYTVSQSGGGSFTSTSGGTGPLSQFTAGKLFYLPYAGSMQAGVEYAFGFHVSTASTIGTSPARLSFLELTNLNNTTLGRISPSTVQVASATIYEAFEGLMHRTTQTGLIASYQDSACQVAVSRARQYLIFET